MTISLYPPCGWIWRIICTRDSTKWLRDACTASSIFDTRASGRYRLLLVDHQFELLCFPSTATEVERTPSRFAPVFTSRQASVCFIDISLRDRVANLTLRACVSIICTVDAEQVRVQNESQATTFLPASLATLIHILMPGINQRGGEAVAINRTLPHLAR